MLQRSSPRIERIAYQIWWLIQTAPENAPCGIWQNLPRPRCRPALRSAAIAAGPGPDRKMARSNALDNGPLMIEALDSELSALFGEAA